MVRTKTRRTKKKSCGVRLDNKCWTGQGKGGERRGEYQSDNKYKLDMNNA